MSAKVKYSFRRGTDRRAVRHEAGDVAPCRPNNEGGAHTPAPAPVSPVARRLALAYYVERCLDAGLIQSYAEAARKLGITRARMTQVMDLLILPAEEPERLLCG